MKRHISFWVFFFVSILAYGGQVLNLRLLPGTVTSDEAIVFWEFPSDYKKVKEYQVYVDGNCVGSTGLNSFRILNLKPSTDYKVEVRSVADERNNCSSQLIHLKTKPAPVVLNVVRYGAKGDGVTINTKAIQQAIDECPVNGEVHIPAGTYITGALFIQRSDISLRLDSGAVLKAVNNLAHFPLVKSRYEGHGVDCFSSVLNLGKLNNAGERFRNIRIYGGGTIDNQGSVLAKLQTENLSRMSRSRGLPIVNCDNVSIDNVTVTNPCTWNIHPLLCNGVTTYNCRIISSNYGLSNADGWDPDSSADCYLLNSVLDGQDDNIAIKSVQYMDENGREVKKVCENIFVSFCYFIQGGGICVGVELPAGVRNVWVTNCTIEKSDRGIMVCSRQNNQGLGAIENIHFRDIDIKQVGDWGFNVNLWYWIPSYMPNSFTSEDIRKIRHIYFENIHIGKAKGNPIQILGLAEQPISDVYFRNITIKETEYDVLLRHCRNISFDHVDIGECHWIYDNAEQIRKDKTTSPEKKFVYPYRLVDKKANYRVKALYDNLHQVMASGRFIFGAQDATASGYGWCDDSGVSDIERISGKKPQFYSWDFMNIATPHASLYVEDTKKVRKLTCQAFYEGGVISYCWHAANPVTGGSFYETGDSIVKKILPGGTHHKAFTDMLDQIAEYNKTLIGKNGEQIPVIFRPWHEFDGDWFWWGKKYCTAKQFKELYRFTVKYLRDTCHVHNFLYAFSPDVNFTSEKEYLERYPGDEYVDIIAMDNYWDFRYDEKDLDKAHLKLKILSDYAVKSGKVAALSETGQAGIDDTSWFTNRLLKAIYGYPNEPVKLAYVAVWRNSVLGFFTPYKGHQATSNFMEFMNDSRVISMNPNDWWMGRYYQFNRK